MPIISFGSLNIDHVYRIQRIVLPGETIAASHYSIHPGGKGLNQSVAMAMAGLDVSHAGRIGADGQWLKTFLQDAGVDCTLVSCNPEEHTGHAIIQVSKNGENSIVLYGGANQNWTPETVRKLFTAQNWEAIVCQNEMNCLKTLFSEGCHRSIPVVLNAAPYSPALQGLDLSLLHSLLLNETEAMALSGEGNIPGAFSHLKILYPDVRIVLTLGGEGVWASYHKQSWKIRPPKVQVIDTTAAGDTFTGYYLASLFHYQPGDLKAALELGCKAAALAVSRHGAALSIPPITEVMGEASLLTK